MNVSFAVTDIVVSEGEGVVTLTLEKTEGAIGPCSLSEDLHHSWISSWYEQRSLEPLK